MATSVLTIDEVFLKLFRDYEDANLKEYIEILSKKKPNHKVLRKMMVPFLDRDLQDIKGLLRNRYAKEVEAIATSFNIKPLAKVRGVLKPKLYELAKYAGKIEQEMSLTELIQGFTKITDKAKRDDYRKRITTILESRNSRVSRELGGVSAQSLFDFLTEVEEEMDKTLQPYSKEKQAKMLKEIEGKLLTAVIVVTHSTGRFISYYPAKEINKNMDLELEGKIYVTPSYSPRWEKLRQVLQLSIQGTFSIGSSVGVEKETYTLNDTDAFLGKYLDMLQNVSSRKKDKKAEKVGKQNKRKFLPELKGRKTWSPKSIIFRGKEGGSDSILFNPHLRKMITDPTYFASVFKTGYTDDKIKEYFPNAQGRNLGSRLFLFEGENYTDALEELDKAEIDYEVNEGRQLVLLDEMLSDKDFFDDEGIDTKKIISEEETLELDPDYSKDSYFFEGRPIGETNQDVIESLEVAILAGEFYDDYFSAIIGKTIRVTPELLDRIEAAMKKFEEDFNTAIRKKILFLADNADERVLKYLAAYELINKNE